MDVRSSIPLGALLISLCFASANDKPQVNQAPPAYVPSGEVMYKQYCAACHGADAKGHGPAAASLKMPPPDLTTLANRHDGKFPYGSTTSFSWDL
jgi:mono/diheme cytochrome c family protein